MSEYQPMSAPPPEESSGRAGGEAPSSIRTSVSLVWAVVGLTVVNALLTLLYVDDLIAASADARGTTIDPDTVRVAVMTSTLFVLVVSVALWVVLGAFLRKGANWARIVITVFAALGLLLGLGRVAGDAGQPVAMLLTRLVTLMVDVALLFFLWRKDSSTFLRSRQA